MEQQEHEKFKCIKKIEFFFNLRFFLKTSPTRRIKYKVIDFAPINKSIMTYKSFLELIWNDFLYGLNLAYALIARNISRINCPKLAEMAIFKHP